jgi:hypothetical protein
MAVKGKEQPARRIYFVAPRDNLSDQRKLYAEPKKAFVKDNSFLGVKLYEKNRKVCLIKTKEAK